MPLDGSDYRPAARHTIVNVPVLEHLDRAIALISDPDDWCKQQLRSFDGRHCMLGAIMATELQPFTRTALKAPILAAIKDVTGRQYERIETFNDHPLTTHAQVMRVMARARQILTKPAAVPVRVPLWRRLFGLAPATVG